MPVDDVEVIAKDFLPKAVSLLQLGWSCFIEEYEVQTAAS